MYWSRVFKIFGLPSWLKSLSLIPIRITIRPLGHPSIYEFVSLQSFSKDYWIYKVDLWGGFLIFFSVNLFHMLCFCFFCFWKFNAKTVNELISVLLLQCAPVIKESYFCLVTSCSKICNSQKTHWASPLYGGARNW